MSHKKKHGGSHEHTTTHQSHASPPSAARETVSGSDTRTPCCEGHARKCEQQEKPTKKSSNPDWWMVYLTGFLGAAAFATFWVLLYTLWEAKGDFVKDQRPYIWIANNTDKWPNNPDFQIQGDRIQATVHYTNFGKSPAIIYRDFQTLILEGGSIPENPNWIYVKMPVPNGSMDTFTSPPSPALSADQIKHYSETPLAVVVYAIWQYTDASGSRYQSEICFGHFKPDPKSDAWMFCKEHNEIKDCATEKCIQ